MDPLASENIKKEKEALTYRLFVGILNRPIFSSMLGLISEELLVRP